MNITCNYIDDLQIVMLSKGKKNAYDFRQWCSPTDPPISHAAWDPTEHPTAIPASYGSR